MPTQSQNTSPLQPQAEILEEQISDGQAFVAGFEKQLKEKLQELKEQQQGLSDQKKRKSKYEEKLKKTRDFLQHLRDEVLEIADLRSKVPQTVSLLRNFTPQELSESAYAGNISVLANSLLEMSSFREEGGVLEKALLDSAEGDLDAGTQAILEYLEFRERNSPTMKIGQDYATRFEDGAFEPSFWDSFSGVASAEIENRNNAIARLVEKAAQIEAVLEQVSAIIRDYEQVQIPRIEEEIKTLNAYIADLQTKLKIEQQQLNSLGQSVSRPAAQSAQQLAPPIPGADPRIVALWQAAGANINDPKISYLISRGRPPASGGSTTEKEDSRPRLSSFEDSLTPGKAPLTGEKARAAEMFSRARQVPGVFAMGIAYLKDYFATPPPGGVVVDDGKGGATVSVPDSAGQAWNDGAEFGANASWGAIGWAAKAAGKQGMKWLVKKVAAKVGAKALAMAMGQVALPIPVVGMIAGMILSKALGSMMGLWKKIKDKLAPTLSALLLMMAKLGAIVSGAIVGGIIGAAAGIVAVLVFGAPLIVGIGLVFAGVGLGGLFAALGTGLGGLLVGVAEGFGSFVGGLLSPGAVTLAPTMGSVAVVGLGVGVPFFLGTTLLSGALATPIEAVDGMGVPAAAFTVEKTAEAPYNLPAIVDNSKDTKTITYSIKVNPVGENKIVIDSITDEAVAYGEFGSKKISDKHPLDQTALTDKISVNFADVPDSRLINTVNVTAHTVGTDSIVQTQTAQYIITIGHPKDSPPYGFPVSGDITTLDTDSVPDKNGFHIHCGEVYENPNASSNGEINIGGSCPKGGIDIAPRQGEGAVISTLDGIVVAAGFNNRLGGYVFVQNGGYYVAFIHLQKPELPAGKHISRGQKIGDVYTAYPSGCGANPNQPGCLLTSTGPHLHYQVLFNGQTLMFADANNAGPCLVKDPKDPAQVVRSNNIEPMPKEKSDLTKHRRVDSGTDCTE